MLQSRTWQAIRKITSPSYRPLNRIELDRECLIHNVSYIQQQHPETAIIPVLKGNAYGHGIDKIAEILNDVQCSLLAVDGYFEASKIRNITKHRILVMGYLLPSNAPLLDARRCSFVVQDTDSLHALGALGKRVRIHVELNTGMNRMGLQPSELENYLTILKSYPTLELEGIMSHLADADSVQNEMSASQVALFDVGVKQVLSFGFRPRFIHIAQTAGSVKTQSRYANAIRLGIGMYGINPLHPSDPKCTLLTGLKPVLELSSTLVKVIELRPGDTVSYNATFKASHPMRIGTLPLGYYEGMSRMLSNVGCVTTLSGETLPILGKVCMNHVTVDLRETDLRVSDRVVVISKDPFSPNSVQGLMSSHHLFPYTTLAGLSETIRREIV